MPFDENTGLFVRTDWSKILPPPKASGKENIIASKTKAGKRAERKQRGLRNSLRLKKIQDDKEAQEKKAEMKILTESELKETKRLEQKRKRRRRESHRIRLQMWKQRRQQEKLDLRAPAAIKDEECAYDFATGVMRSGAKEGYNGKEEVNVKMEELPIRLKLPMAPRFKQGSQWGVLKTTNDDTGKDDFTKSSNNIFPSVLKKEDLGDIEEDAMRQLEEAREGFPIENDNEYDYDTDFIDDSGEQNHGYRVGLACPKLVPILHIARKLGATASGTH